MQMSQPGPVLLTALEVQELLHIDRSTVYRMAEDGRLPSVRVGRSWRFPADQIRALLPLPLEVPVEPGRDEQPTQHQRGGDSAESAAPALNTAVARAAVEVAADLLGVMMVVTDMAGNPVTSVANPCSWFTDRQGDPEVLAACVAEWRDLADHPDLTPRFQPGALGFECARAFVRSGSTLVGMVLAGGVSADPEPGQDPDLYHLDEAQRGQVLAALPRVAAAISTSSTPAASTSPATPAPGAPATTTPTAPPGVTKEN